MSIRRQQPQPRRVRRQRQGPAHSGAVRGMDVPGPLRFLTNPKLFAVVALIFAGAIIFSLLAGSFGVGTASDPDAPVQMNEAEDIPRGVDGEAEATPDAETSPTPTVKRYTTAPELTIDPSRTYTATIATSKGEIQIELYPESAPQAVNAFVFLAEDGYYTGTKFLEVTNNPDGSRFTAQAGDPTNTGLGSPGFTLPQELTDLPFTEGAVGMDSGQFFISYDDYPSLTGKYSIIGRVVSGMDVLEQISLLDVDSEAGGPGDEIESITITES